VVELPRRLQLHHQRLVIQAPVLILPAGTILMGQCTIANGMVTKVLMMKDALNTETGMKIKDRQRKKHAVHVVEGKPLTFVRIATKNSGIRQQRGNIANL
jgi:hypothetical protein